MAKKKSVRKVYFSTARVVKMFRAGQRVSEIARAVGFKRGCGQNRVSAALVKAGVKK